MTLIAGALDVNALLDTAAAGPLEMIDAATQEATEAAAQDLAKNRPESATARALVLVSGEASRWYKAYTDETKARSNALTSELELAKRLLQRVAEAAPAEASDHLAVVRDRLANVVELLTDREALLAR